MSHEINPIANQPIITGVDVDRDGTIDLLQVEQQSANMAQTGIYNVHTVEGRQAFQQTLLDLGLSLPEFMSSADEAFIQKLDPKDLAALQQLAKEASAMHGSGSTDGAVTAGLQGRWADFVAGTNMKGGQDVNALVQFVLREAYMENTKDLHFYAQKVRFYNELKKSIREELTKARKFLSSQAEAAAAWVQQNPDNNLSENYHFVDQPYPGLEFYTTPEYDETKGMMPKPPAEYGVDENGTVVDPLDTKGKLETYIKGLEEKLNSVGDDAQLANVDLQNMLQKQQQTLQMMSNISKMLHDTAMAIIRKMGS